MILSDLEKKLNLVVTFVSEFAFFIQEYLENGPLFSELKFYQRAAKDEQSKLLQQSSSISI